MAMTKINENLALEVRGLLKTFDRDKLLKFGFERKFGKGFGGFKK
jgi:hypothetical protein